MIGGLFDFVLIVPSIGGFKKFSKFFRGAKGAVYHGFQLKKLFVVREVPPPPTFISAAGVPPPPMGGK